MGNFVNYQKVQLKRTLKVFPTILFMTMLLLAGAGLLFFMFLKLQQTQPDEPKKYQIGIVGDTDDPFLTMGIATVQDMDSSRFIMDFIILEKEDAEERMKNGELSAYLIVPEDFVHSVMIGENKKIRFISSEGNVDLSTLLLNEVVGIISRMLTESQAAGSGLYAIMKENGLQDSYGTYADMQDLKIALTVLTRTDLYEIETFESDKTISVISYYVCGIFLFFLSIWGINASGILAVKNRSMERLLKSRGHSVASQVVAEYLAYFGLLLLSMLILCFLAFMGMKISERTLAEWNYATEGIVFRFFVQLIPVFLLVCAVQFFLYECTQDCISAILLQFVVAIGLSYLSGCFYPISFFPEMIQKLNQALPTGIALSYMCDCIMEEVNPVDILKMTAFVLCFVFCSALIRKVRLNDIL